MNGKKLIKKRKDSISVCYLIDVLPEKFRGGGQTHLLNLICQMQVQSANWRTKFKVKSFGGPSPNILVRFLWSVWVIPQIIFYHCFKDKFDLIHAHSIPATVAGKIISILLKIPIVVTVHGFNEKPGLEKFVLTRIKYDRQITVARNFLEYPNVNKVIYIPNGVDMEKYGPQHYASQSRGLRPRVMAAQVRGSGVPADFSYEKSGLVRKSSKLKIVLFVGRKSDPVKGFSILEKAMKIVKKEIPDVELLVMDGSYSQKDVISSYHKADLLVLPSLSEGFPLTLLEAWAAKLPVVATRVGELPYLVKNGINSYLVDVGSAKKLAAIIIQALKNRNLAKLGKNGYNLARRFNWRSVAEKTIKIYESIIINSLIN